MPDAWRAYLQMALGLTEEPRKKAQKVAGDLVSKGGATAAQVQGLAEDLLSTGLANREALTNIVRYEVDRALGVVGLATADEVSELTTRVRDLEKQLRNAQARAVAAETSGAVSGGTQVGRPEQPTIAAAPAGPSAPTPIAKKAIAKKAVAKAAPVVPAKVPPVLPARVSPVKALPVDVPQAKVPPAKKASPLVQAPAASVRKAVAKKAVAKKAAAKEPSGPIAPAEPSVPAGTTVPPTAVVKEAAAATFLPPVAAAEPVVSAKRGRAASVNPFAPAKGAPVKSAPAKSAPVKPLKSAPVKPLKSVPVKPLKSVPGKPVQGAPVKRAVPRKPGA